MPSQPENSEYIAEQRQPRSLHCLHLCTAAPAHHRASQPGVCYSCRLEAGVTPLDCPPIESLGACWLQVLSVHILSGNVQGCCGSHGQYGVLMGVGFLQRHDKGEDLSKIAPPSPKRTLKRSAAALAALPRTPKGNNAALTLATLSEDSSRLTLSCQPCATAVIGY